MENCTFAERLKSILDNKGITRYQLCKDIGISKGSFVHWEERGNIPSGDVVYKISKYLNVSMSYLINGTEDDGVEENLYIQNVYGPELEEYVESLDQEHEIIQKFNKLSEHGKTIFLGMLEVLIINDIK